jgi:hypothetical protein
MKTIRVTRSRLKGWIGAPKGNENAGKQKGKICTFENTAEQVAAAIEKNLTQRALA